MRSLFFCIAFFILPSFAFSTNIEGYVTTKDKSPIVGAYVIHIQSDHHAHTNEFGKFYINEVNVGDSLQIIYLGYETLIYIIETDDEKITIEMVEGNFELDEIVVGQSNKQINIITAIDVLTSPVKSSQEILRKVPGLFIGQHAGGGKAEQIFLRGFDIDHGTDVAISVDGIPVNMVSHAHAQGYADLHFIIPETISKIDFGKGPYYADVGNFGTAGYVQFKTKDVLESSQISQEYGAFNTSRTLAMLNILDTDQHSAYIAADYSLSDGPFESSQNFSRNNFFAKYAGNISNSERLTVLASHFNSKWDASGQIPVRAVEQGLISRFGAIDDTEGGKTSRSNLSLNYTKSINESTFIKSNVFYSLYHFELFSNFTFFLNDPINGDQIRQFEDRKIFGMESSWNKTSYLGNTIAEYLIGLGLRNDDISDNQLSRTKNRREILSRLQFGDVNESNIYTFVDAEFDFGKWLIQLGVRFDFFKFNYVDNLNPLYNRLSELAAIVSPKFNVIYNMNTNVQLFAKSGIGFHSNDSRVVLDQQGRSALPPAYGFDLGTVVKPTKRVFVNFALWYLFLQQEFVYVGDEGIVEPSGRTRRVGFDFGVRFQINDWLFANGDFNYAQPRSLDNSDGEQFIPLAPTTTATVGLSIKRRKLSVNLQSRYIADRAANENKSIIAKGYLITDLNATYDFGVVSIGVSVKNLFDQEWNETQFATESRLASEINSTEEIHFTPGAPLFSKGIIKYKF
ncbi:MAG: hypothetical protein ACJA1A_001642 [Saprospiraceae bacterium]|jgi:hypothetical protein